MRDGYRWQQPAPEAVKAIRARRSTAQLRAWHRLLPNEYGRLPTLPGRITGCLTGAPELAEWPGTRGQCDPHMQTETEASPVFRPDCACSPAAPAEDQS